MFDSLRKSLRSMFSSAEKMLDEIEADFPEIEDVPANTEKVTESETRHPDGSVTITKTVTRHIVRSSITKKTRPLPAVCRHSASLSPKDCDACIEEAARNQ